MAIHSYFIYNSQGSVKTHLRGGGTYNSHIIANCPQSELKKCWESVNNWQRYGQKV